MRSIALEGNRISDYSPLEGSGLTHFTALDCGLSDISFVAKLEHLQELTLANNPIASLEPLRGKTFMRLILNDCGLDNIDPLVDVGVASLSLQDNPIVDLSPLQGKPINSISLKANPIEDLSPLEDSGLQITHLNGLRDLLSLNSLKHWKTLPVSILANLI